MSRHVISLVRLIVRIWYLAPGSRPILIPSGLILLKYAYMIMSQYWAHGKIIVTKLQYMTRSAASVLCQTTFVWDPAFTSYVVMWFIEFQHICHYISQTMLFLVLIYCRDPFSRTVQVESYLSSDYRVSASQWPFLQLSSIFPSIMRSLSSVSHLSLVAVLVCLEYNPFNCRTA